MTNSAGTKAPPSRTACPAGWVRAEMRFNFRSEAVESRGLRDAVAQAKKLNRIDFARVYPAHPSGRVFSWAERARKSGSGFKRLRKRAVAIQLATSARFNFSPSIRSAALAATAILGGSLLVLILLSTAAAMGVGMWIAVGGGL